MNEPNESAGATPPNGIIAGTGTENRPSREEIARNLQDNSVILNLELKRPGKSAKASLDEIEIDADKSMLRMSKDIFDSPEYGAVASYDSWLRQQITKRYASPAKYLRGGMYRISIRMIEKIYALMDEAAIERQNRIDAFLEAYPRLQTEAEDKLGVLYDPLDYPSAQVIRQKFSFHFEIVTTVVSERLKTLSRGVYEAEKQKQMVKVMDEIQDVTDALRMQALDMTRLTLEKLTPREDGKKRKFNATATEGLTEFFQMLQDRNLTGDMELDRLAEQGRALMEGKSAQDIRDSDALRTEIVAGLGQIAEQLDKMTETVPKRRFNFAMGEK